jgi:AraC family transcriptional regulator
MDRFRYDTILFRRPLATIGRFYCRADRPDFEQTGPIHAHLFVFPRTSVSITHSGASSVVADPNVAMFYNEAQEYRRGRISPEGDLCYWFAVEPPSILDAIEPLDPAVRERPERPYPFSCGPCGPSRYLALRQLIGYLRREKSPDPLYVEEAALGLLGGLVRDAYAARGRQSRAGARAERAHAEVAEAAKAEIARRLYRPLALADIARSVGVSPFHLSRVFRRKTGATVHSYLNQLRLREGAALLSESKAGLTEIALALGYSSHSHFTQAFHRAFGLTPSRLRERLVGRPRRNLRGEQEPDSAA